MRENKKYSKTIKKKKNIYRPYIMLLSSIVLIFLIKNIYISLKCQELYNAADYLFTTKQCGDSSLLRVQHMTLIYSDNEKATIKVSGLNKKPPHETIAIEGEFKKNSFNSWDLVKYKEIDINE